MSKHTPGPWVARALGGHSVVLCPALPVRNDRRAKVGYGYSDEAFSVAYPFLDDEDRVRMDFVCFSHDDARLIAAAPEMLEVLKETLPFMIEIAKARHPRFEPSMADDDSTIGKAIRAIAKAEGRS